MRPHPRPTRYNRYILPSRIVRWGALALGLAAALPTAQGVHGRDIIGMGADVEHLAGVTR